MRRTKIVATIGPASRDPETLARMVEAGVDVFRLNFSHGTRELHAENAQRVRAAASNVGRPVAILQDLPGPKIRIGALKDDLAELKPGERLVLACGSEDLGDGERMSVSWPGLAGAVEPEDVIYLADGAIRLRVRSLRARASTSRVRRAGCPPCPSRISTCCALGNRSASTSSRCPSCARPRM
jgi:pyruvate kinase